MVTLVDVGVSPVLRVPQFIDARGVPNLYAFRIAFEARWGQPLNVTEGARSRPRQRALWYAWQAYLAGGAWAVRAAALYYSIHDAVTKALALDFGSGLASASDPRAIWARANAPKYGIHPTGYGFGEPWHYEIRPGTETVSLTTTAGDSGTQITPKQREAEMYIVTDTNPNGGKYLVGPGGLTHILGPADDTILNALINGNDTTFTFSEVKRIEFYMQKLNAVSTPAIVDVAAIKAAVVEALAALPAGTTSPTAGDIANELAKRLGS